jgi:hypothetical protein
MWTRIRTENAARGTLPTTMEGRRVYFQMTMLSTWIFDWHMKSIELSTLLDGVFSGYAISVAFWLCQSFTCSGVDIVLFLGGRTFVEVSGLLQGCHAFLQHSGEGRSRLVGLQLHRNSLKKLIPSISFSSPLRIAATCVALKKRPGETRNFRS